MCAFAQEPTPARQPAPAHRPTLRTHVAPVVRPQQNDARPGGGSAAPIERRPPAMNAGGEAQVSANPHPGTATGKGFNNPGASSLYNGKGEHLSAWMKAHGNMTLQQQQAALEHEPGFRELPPETQQRYRDRLSELNALPPAERQRRLAYTEQMERLTPQQRTEVRSTMLQLSER